MSQDLRTLFKGEREKKIKMKKGHEARFLARMDRELPQKKATSFFTLKLAASLLLLLGLGVLGYLRFGTSSETAPTTVVEKKDTLPQQQGISLGDLSPDLKKVENYYVANINMTLSELEVSPENKALVDSFMTRLALLNEEYQRLNKELNEIGPNDHTISALIKNLQLRLELLYKLKDKLNELKSSENEQFTSESI